MRAGRYDIVLETGARWERSFQWLEPTAAIPASAVPVGERVYVDGWPQKVYAVEPLANGQVRFLFGHGLWNDLVLTVSSTALVVPAEPIPMVAVAAAIYAKTDPESIVEEIPIPVVIEPGNLSATLLLDADTTVGLASIEGAHSWDCYAQAAGYDWQRIIEGIVTVIDGDAR